MQFQCMKRGRRGAQCRKRARYQLSGLIDGTHNGWPVAVVFTSIESLCEHGWADVQRRGEIIDGAAILCPEHAEEVMVWQRTVLRWSNAATSDEGRCNCYDCR